MINSVVLVGRITADPELRKSLDDTSICNFVVAVDDRNKDKTTSFIEVVVFGALADNITKYCKKGAKIGVDGVLHQRHFERKDGSKASKLEVVASSVVFLDSKAEEAPKTKKAKSSKSKKAE